MTFDVQLTVGIDPTGARSGADEAVRSIDRIAEASRSLDSLNNQTGRAISESLQAVNQVNASAASEYSGLANVGSSAWERIAEAAEVSSNRQIDAANRATSAASRASAAPTSVIGFAGFSPEQSDQAQAEANLAFLQRLSGGRNLSTADLQRAQNIGLAGFDSGLSQQRVTQAIQFQTEALDVILRRRDLEGRQNGGQVSAGRPYIVGERGPEIFVPGTSGRIENQTSNSTINITVNGAQNPNEVARQVVNHINRQAARGNPMIDQNSVQSRIRQGG